MNTKDEMPNWMTALMYVGFIILAVILLLKDNEPKIIEVPEELCHKFRFDNHTLSLGVRDVNLLVVTIARHDGRLPDEKGVPCK